MKRPLIILRIAALLALAVSGCTTVGPDYREPTPTVQKEWIEQKDPSLDTAATMAPEWWKTAFNDPILDRLVEIALAQNLTLRSAALRVLQARQQLAIAIGNQYPQQQQLSGEAAIARQNRNTYEIYDLGFNLSWEADIWGRFKRQIESASASLDARFADYDGVMVTLITQVAQNYLLIRTTQQRIAVAKRNIELQQESVRIANAKHVAGEVSALDVEQARTLFHNTEASLPSLEISLQQFKNALAVLLGRPPQDMSALLGEVQPVPSVAPEIALGMPQDLIRRRPDIRAAERQLASQSAQIGFAVSELYPHFVLGGSIGTTVSTATTLNFSDLFSSKSFVADLFGSFQWNIFNYGRLKNNVRLQDAIFQQFLEDYRETVLQAQAEVENAIVAFLKSRQQLQALKSAADAAQRAADVSTEQYQDGLVDFNTVLSTLTALVSQQDLLATALGTVAGNLVEVYASLGGAWEIRQSQDPLDLIPEGIQTEMLERGKYWQETLHQK